MNAIVANHAGFENLFTTLVRDMIDQPIFDRGEVHAQKVINLDMQTRELRYVTMGFRVPQDQMPWSRIVSPNLPWAEDHFQERVSGEPLNPPPSEQYWPFAQQGNSAHKKNQLFSHTYPERFWSKQAGHLGQKLDFERMGIRFPHGDLDDVVEVLKKNPRSRQAYLPVWFPEDLAAAKQGERVPCTLGYHFLLHPSGALDASYYMRSCDLIRFWRDDVYMAGRLLQWVAGRIGVVPGTLRLDISSLHVFQGDTPYLRAVIDQAEDDNQYGAWV